MGALVGLAVGDAVGATNEFKPPGTFEPITDMVGGGPFQLEPGQWTDDTSMALCMGESLVQQKDFVPKDINRMFVRWWKTGHHSAKGYCFDIGGNTREALSWFIRHEGEYPGLALAAEALENPSRRGPYPVGSSNGSIMRLAPIAMAYWQHHKLLAMARQSSLLTHAHPEAVDSCRVLASVIAGAIAGKNKDELLNPVIYCYPAQAPWTECERLNPSVFQVVSGSYRRRHRDLIEAGFGAVACLEAALWAFWHGSSFFETVLLAANLGDDADTVGAVAGQIAGAYYGLRGALDMPISAIPPQWVERLHNKDGILAMASQLWDLSCTHTGRK